MVRPIQTNGKLNKAVVISGLRTPFVKPGQRLRRLSSLELGAIVVRELLERTELAPDEVDAVVFGQVNSSAANIARDIVLLAGLPRAIDAYSTSRSCATSTQAIAEAMMLIQTGQAKVVIAGGADSANDVPRSVSKRLAEV